MKDEISGPKQLAKRLDTYCWGIVSEEYNGVVRIAMGVIAPVIRLEFAPNDVQGEWRDHYSFALALPASATFGEIREALSTMPTDGGEWEINYREHIVSRLWRRYEECRVPDFLKQSELAAQTFRNQQFNAIADITLLEEERWSVLLNMLYSFNSNHMKMPVKGNESVGLVVEELMAVGQIRSNAFTMPVSIFEE